MSVALTYNRNGATGGSVPVDATAYTEGASAVVQGNVGALNLAGYTFAGWNTSADGTGMAYAPGALIALAADTTIYAIWSSASSLITPTGLRAHVSTSLTDAALQEIIDAEEAAIIERCGSNAAEVEEFEDEYPGALIFPKCPVASVTSIIEKWVDSFIGGISSTTLDATDYEIVSGGKQIRRLSTGTHPLSCWGNRVVLTYTPTSDTSRRVKALIDLCALSLSAKPGYKSESVGGGEYSYTAADIEAEREKILARLGSGQRTFA
jgi:uncharacterized repeat protein (TIGR02543 family)